MELVSNSSLGLSKDHSGDLVRTNVTFTEGVEDVCWTPSAAMQLLAENNGWVSVLLECVESVSGSTLFPASPSLPPVDLAAVAEFDSWLKTNIKNVYEFPSLKERVEVSYSLWELQQFLASKSSSAEPLQWLGSALLWWLGENYIHQVLENWGIEETQIKQILAHPRVRRLLERTPHDLDFRVWFSDKNETELWQIVAELEQLFVTKLPKRFLFISEEDKLLQNYLKNLEAESKYIPKKLKDRHEALRRHIVRTIFFEQRPILDTREGYSYLLVKLRFPAPPLRPGTANLDACELPVEFILCANLKLMTLEHDQWRLSWGPNKLSSLTPYGDDETKGAQHLVHRVCGNHTLRDPWTHKHDAAGLLRRLVAYGRGDSSWLEGEEARVWCQVKESAVFAKDPAGSVAKLIFGAASRQEIPLMDACVLSYWQAYLVWKDELTSDQWLLAWKKLAGLCKSANLPKEDRKLHHPFLKCVYSEIVNKRLENCVSASRQVLIGLLMMKGNKSLNVQVCRHQGDWALQCHLEVSGKHFSFLIPCKERGLQLEVCGERWIENRKESLHSWAELICSSECVEQAEIYETLLLAGLSPQRMEDQAWKLLESKDKQLVWLGLFFMNSIPSLQSDFKPRRALLRYVARLWYQDAKQFAKSGFNLLRQLLKNAPSHLESVEFPSSAPKLRDWMCLLCNSTHKEERKLALQLFVDSCSISKGLDGHFNLETILLKQLVNHDLELAAELIAKMKEERFTKFMSQNKNFVSELFSKARAQCKPGDQLIQVAPRLVEYIVLAAKTLDTQNSEQVVSLEWALQALYRQQYWKEAEILIQSLSSCSKGMSDEFTQIRWHILLQKMNEAVELSDKVSLWMNAQPLKASFSTELTELTKQVFESLLKPGHAAASQGEALSIAHQLAKTVDEKAQLQCAVVKWLERLQEEKKITVVFEQMKPWIGVLSTEAVFGLLESIAVKARQDNRAEQLMPLLITLLESSLTKEQERVVAKLYQDSIDTLDPRKKPVQDLFKKLCDKELLQDSKKIEAVFQRFGDFPQELWAVANWIITREQSPDELLAVVSLRELVKQDIPDCKALTIVLSLISKISTEELLSVPQAWLSNLLKKVGKQTQLQNAEQLIRWLEATNATLSEKRSVWQSMNNQIVFSDECREKFHLFPYRWCQEALRQDDVQLADDCLKDYIACKTEENIDPLPILGGLMQRWLKEERPIAACLLLDVISRKDIQANPQIQEVWINAMRDLAMQGDMDFFLKNLERFIQSVKTWDKSAEWLLEITQEGFGRASDQPLMTKQIGTLIQLLKQLQSKDTYLWRIVWQQLLNAVDQEIILQAWTLSKEWLFDSHEEHAEILLFALKAIAKMDHDLAQQVCDTHEKQIEAISQLSGDSQIAFVLQTMALEYALNAAKRDKRELPQVLKRLCGRRAQWEPLCTTAQEREATNRLGWLLATEMVGTKEDECLEEALELTAQLATQEVHKSHVEPIRHFLSNLLRVLSKKMKSDSSQVSEAWNRFSEALIAQKQSALIVMAGVIPIACRFNLREDGSHPVVPLFTAFVSRLKNCASHETEPCWTEVKDAVLTHCPEIWRTLYQVEGIEKNVSKEDIIAGLNQHFLTWTSGKDRIPASNAPYGLKQEFSSALQKYPELLMEPCFKYICGEMLKGSNQSPTPQSHFIATVVSLVNAIPSPFLGGWFKTWKASESPLRHSNVRIEPWISFLEVCMEHTRFHPGVEQEVIRLGLKLFEQLTLDILIEQPEIQKRLKNLLLSVYARIYAYRGDLEKNRTVYELKEIFDRWVEVLIKPDTEEFLKLAYKHETVLVEQACGTLEIHRAAFKNAVEWALSMNSTQTVYRACTLFEKHWLQLFGDSDKKLWKPLWDRLVAAVQKNAGWHIQDKYIPTHACRAACKMEIHRSKKYAQERLFEVMAGLTTYAKELCSELNSTQELEEKYKEVVRDRAISHFKTSLEVIVAVTEDLWHQPHGSSKPWEEFYLLCEALVDLAIVSLPDQSERISGMIPCILRSLLLPDSQRQLITDTHKKKVFALIKKYTETVIYIPKQAQPVFVDLTMSPQLPRFSELFNIEEYETLKQLAKSQVYRQFDDQVDAICKKMCEENTGKDWSNRLFDNPCRQLMTIFGAMAALMPDSLSHEPIRSNPERVFEALRRMGKIIIEREKKAEGVDFDPLYRLFRNFCVKSGENIPAVSEQLNQIANEQDQLRQEMKKGQKLSWNKPWG